MSTLTDLTSALSGAAPYAGAITALANLGIDITKLITPTEQDYDAQFQADCRKAADLITAIVEKPGVDSDVAFTAFDNELLADTGRPIVGGISAECVTIRVDRLLAHACDSAELKLYRALFAQLNNAGQQQPTKQAAVTTAVPKGAA